MNFFRVYLHKSKGYYAAPIGFNIQAAILIFLWAAANNLWSKALLLFVFAASMLAIVFYGKSANMEILMYVGIAGISIVPLWSGVSANQWVFNSLENQGYTLIRKIRAKDAHTAISQARKSTSTGKSSLGKATKRAAKSAEDLPINTEPEWRRRRNNRIIK